MMLISQIILKKLAREMTSFRIIVDDQVKFIQAESYSLIALTEKGLHRLTLGISSQLELIRMDVDIYTPSEDVSQYNSAIRGSRLDFNMSFNEPGEYHVWLRMKGNSYGNDTVGLFWDFTDESPVEFEKYHSFGWTSNGDWEWEQEFHRSPISINVSGESQHTLSIFMIEDGVHIDEILITSIASLNRKSIDALME